MIETIAPFFPGIEKQWRQYKHWFSEITVPRKTVLLKEGSIPRKIFFVKQGCLRTAIHSRGKDVTFQFFFEQDVIASIESLRTNQPSPISIESIEPSTIIVLQKKGFETLLRDFPQLKEVMFEYVFRRFAHYSKLFVSNIKDTPRQRYMNLLKESPHIIQRVPQHYIASYLGITPVSLSRIRKRI